MYLDERQTTIGHTVRSTYFNDDEQVHDMARQIHVHFQNWSRLLTNLRSQLLLFTKEQLEFGVYIYVDFLRNFSVIFGLSKFATNKFLTQSEHSL